MHPSLLSLQAQPQPFTILTAGPKHRYKTHMAELTARVFSRDLSEFRYAYSVARRVMSDIIYYNHVFCMF